MQVDKKRVGERICQIRQQNGYSMEQFGKQIGDAPRGSVNSWEKGVNLPNKERLEMIAVMGNTTVNELLYGSFSDYVRDLIDTSLGIKISYHFTIPFAAQLQARGFTYGDDVAILRFAKGFFNANNIVTKRPSLFYTLISEQDNLFVGYLEVAQDETVPKFFAFSDVEKDTLHIVPYTLNNSFDENYTYPSTITEPEGHDYFTSGFTALQLSLRGFTLIYYGVDVENFCPCISRFHYDVDLDTLVLDTESPESSELYLPFVKCAEEEALYRKNNDR